MNDTINKFGYPETLLKKYKNWVVMLRPTQVTAGCMVLACKESAISMADVSAVAFAELPIVTGELEAALKKTFQMEKINYLCLMMVDKEVHFHVIPRYSENKEFAGVQFDDPGWAKAPDLGNVIEMTAEQFESLKKHLMDCW